MMVTLKVSGKVCLPCRHVDKNMVYCGPRIHEVVNIVLLLILPLLVNQQKHAHIYNTELCC